MNALELAREVGASPEQTEHLELCTFCANQDCAGARAQDVQPVQAAAVLQRGMPARPLAHNQAGVKNITDTAHAGQLHES